MTRSGHERAAFAVMHNTWLFFPESHGADDLRHLLQIGDQIGTISSVRHSRVRHAVGRYRRLGFGDEGVEGFRRPRDAAIPERPRVAVISHLASLAAKNAVEGRPDAVHATLDRVACHATCAACRPILCSFSL